MTPPPSDEADLPLDERKRLARRLQNRDAQRRRRQSVQQKLAHLEQLQRDAEYQRHLQSGRAGQPRPPLPANTTAGFGAVTDHPPPCGINNSGSGPDDASRNFAGYAPIDLDLSSTGPFTPPFIDDSHADASFLPTPDGDASFNLMQPLVTPSPLPSWWSPEPHQHVASPNASSAAGMHTLTNYGQPVRTMGQQRHHEQVSSHQQLPQADLNPTATVRAAAPKSPHSSASPSIADTLLGPSANQTAPSKQHQGSSGKHQDAMPASSLPGQNSHPPRGESMPDRRAGGDDTNPPSGTRALHMATRSGCVSMVRALLKHGAFVHLPDEHGDLPLHCCALLESARSDEALQIARLLVEHGADANARDRSGMTALQHAAIAGNVRMVEGLAELGADVNSV